MILAFRLRFVVFFCVWQALGMPWKNGSLDPWWSDHLWMFFCCNISLCWSWITKEQIQKIGGKDKDTLSTSESAIVLKIHRGNSLGNVLTSTDFNGATEGDLPTDDGNQEGSHLEGHGDQRGYAPRRIGRTSTILETARMVILILFHVQTHGKRRWDGSKGLFLANLRLPFFFWFFDLIDFHGFISLGIAGSPPSASLDPWPDQPCTRYSCRNLERYVLRRRNPGVYPGRFQGPKEDGVAWVWFLLLLLLVVVVVVVLIGFGYVVKGTILSSLLCWTPLKVAMLWQFMGKDLLMTGSNLHSPQVTSCSRGSYH